MPIIKLSEEAKQLLSNYKWKGNVRQLKNVTEQIAIIEADRDIGVEKLRKYLPEDKTNILPVLYKGKDAEQLTEREILYKVLFEMRSDVNELRSLIKQMLSDGGNGNVSTESLKRIYQEPFEKENISHQETEEEEKHLKNTNEQNNIGDNEINYIDSQLIEESLSLEEKEKEIIKKALHKYSGKRKYAAQELGISERTLYRKIKEYNIDL